jgi:hypothetical protein
MVSGRSLAIVDSPLGAGGRFTFQNGGGPEIGYLNRGTQLGIRSEPRRYQQHWARSSKEKGQTNDKKNFVAGKSAGSCTDCDAVVVPGIREAKASDQPAAANAEIKIDNFSFGPPTITVQVGSTFTWTDRDDIPHTSVST